MLRRSSAKKDPHSGPEPCRFRTAFFFNRFTLEWLLIMAKFDVKDFKFRVKNCKTGKGLFAEDDIPAGVCFLEYKGRELTEDEKYTSTSRYLFEINKKVTLDGWVKGNTARYINYACDPNAEFDTKGDRVFVFSTKKIKKGEQITIDYGEEYFEEYIKGKCLCDSCTK